MHWIIGIDDGYFPYEYKGMRGTAPLVAVLGNRSLIRDLEITKILVDVPRIDKDLTSIINSLISRNKDLEIRLVVTDSVVFAGFAIYDPWELYSQINTPVAVIFSHQLNLLRIKSALEKHFTDHEERYSIIKKAYTSSKITKTPRGLLRILCIGLDQDECIDIIVENQTIHKYPQPLRTADLIASAIGRYLSIEENN